MRKQILISTLLLVGLALAYDEMTLQSFMNDTIDQRLDHFDGKIVTTFKQRYFWNDTYWNTQFGPIFLYICGEGTCKPPSERGFPFQICQDMGCLFYVLEHRYYGASQPFLDWSTGNLKYLNSTQALADIDYFIKDRNADLQKKYGSGLRKWVTIGGSYPGALSAWFKSQYPTSATAAWSSSGVINAIRDYEEYDLDVYLSTGRSGDYCPAMIKNISDFVDKAFADNSTDLEYIQQLFGNKGIDNGDFMYYFADIFAGAVQGGRRSGLCDLLNSLQGVSVYNQLPAIKQYADQTGLNLPDYDRVTIQNTTYDINKNMRQWTWQICTEFGWFQVPNQAHPMRSNLIGPQYWGPFCQAVFGAENITGEPAVAYYNDLYGGYNISGSNIVFVNAAEDPWQYAGLRKISDPNTQSGFQTILIDCKNCAHCVDLKTPTDSDTPPLKLGRRKIQAQLTTWLTPTQEEIDQIVKDHAQDLDFELFLQ